MPQWGVAKRPPQYLNESQPSEAIADLVKQLLSGEHPYKSGDIILLKMSQPHVEFHA
jgi:hypothetical protein